MIHGSIAYPVSEMSCDLTVPNSTASCILLSSNHHNISLINVSNEYFRSKSRVWSMFSADIHMWNVFPAWFACCMIHGGGCGCLLSPHRRVDFAVATVWSLGVVLVYKLTAYKGQCLWQYAHRNTVMQCRHKHMHPLWKVHFALALTSQTNESEGNGCPGYFTKWPLTIRASC